MKESTRLFTHIMAGALLMVATGCEDAEMTGDLEPKGPTEMETQEQELFYKSSWLWNFEDTADTPIFSVGEIPVCFKDPLAENEEERDWVESILTGDRSWSAYGGIEFVGWGDCDDGYQYGIEVVATESASSGLGLKEGEDWISVQLPFLRPDPEAMFLQCKPNGLSRRGCIEVLALHEFGHSLGFSHEHERADAPASCTDDLGPGDFQLPGDYTFGVWDPVSVVSYCGDAIDLSPIDIAGVQAVYGSDYIHKFGYDQGWRDAIHSRLTADVNGDGRHDIVGFGNDGVEVSLARADGFEEPTLWTAIFGVESMGWQKDQYPVVMSDLNGDGLDDIVGFYAGGVAGAVSNGTQFVAAKYWLAGHFGSAPSVGAWNSQAHLRYLSDVNGDGLDDIVGFGEAGVQVAINTGDRFEPPTYWSNYFGSAAGWNQRYYPRMMADVNGDGREDLIAFYNGVYVGLSTGTGFSLQYWGPDFGSNQGWDGERHLRVMSDVNGDGRMDVVGFGDDGVYVARSTGTSFTAKELWHDDFGYDAVAGSWRIETHPRTMADVNGDGQDDVVGFGADFVNVALSTGSTFTESNPWVLRYAASDGLDIHENPRTLADVDGDGVDDIVGFLNHGTLITSLGNISAQTQFIQED